MDSRYIAVFILTLLTPLLFLLLLLDKHPSPHTKRREIGTWSPSDVDVFIQGIQHLKSTGAYDRLTNLHGNQTLFPLVHRTVYFLPWHRWLILEMEKEIQSLGKPYKSFRLPYWDWLDAPTLPEMAGGYGKAPTYCVRDGPWANWTTTTGKCLVRRKDPTIQLWSQDSVCSLFRQHASYGSSNNFSLAFENGPHAQVHLSVGGNMETQASPDDPLFWMHHAFVDALWTAWQTSHPHASFDPSTIDTVMPGTPGITPRQMISRKIPFERSRPLCGETFW